MYRREYLTHDGIIFILYFTLKSLVFKDIYVQVGRNILVGSGMRKKNF
jgi:hypothetical protein